MPVVCVVPVHVAVLVVAEVFKVSAESVVSAFPPQAVSVSTVSPASSEHWSVAEAVLAVYIGVPGLGSAREIRPHRCPKRPQNAVNGKTPHKLLSSGGFWEMAVRELLCDGEAQCFVERHRVPGGEPGVRVPDHRLDTDELREAVARMARALTRCGGHVDRASSPTVERDFR